MRVPDFFERYTNAGRDDAERDYEQDYEYGEDQYGVTEEGGRSGETEVEGEDGEGEEVEGELVKGVGCEIAECHYTIGGEVEGADPIEVRGEVVRVMDYC